MVYKVATMSSDKLLSISEAARATGKSIPTIRNYLDKGKLPNATSKAKGSSKAWLIPLADLVAAGLLDKVSTPSEPALAPVSEVMELREQVAALKAENSQLRERLDDLKQSRADLIAAYAPQIETSEKQARRRSWFSRR
jgi:DNA-binding transcriptional MerR regulator